MSGVSQSEFARQQGWAKSYVTKLKGEGRLVLTADGRVDVAASRARIAATAAHTRPDAATRAAAWRAQQAGLFTAPVHAVNIGGGARAAGEDGAPDGAGVRMRRLREGIKREAGLIELGLLRGELLERADVDREWSRLGVGLRAGIEASVERLAPVLAAAPDRASAAALIAAEVRLERRRFTRALVAAARAAGRGAPQ